MGVLKDLQVQIGEGYSVPDFMLSSEDHLLEASSGVALKIKSRPLKKKRENKIELVKPAIRDLYEIEKALIATFHKPDDENGSAVNLLLECKQHWDAGELKLPENKKEKIEWITSLLTAGVVDIIWALREIEILADDQEAIALYEKMEKRFKKYAPLKEEEPEVQPPKTVGANRGKGNAFGKKK